MIEGFFQFPWEGVAGFVGALIGLSVLLPKTVPVLGNIGSYVQRRIQDAIGVSEYFADNKAAHERLEKQVTKLDQKLDNQMANHVDSYHQSTE